MSDKSAEWLAAIGAAIVYFIFAFGILALLAYLLPK